MGLAVYKEVLDSFWPRIVVLKTGLEPVRLAAGDFKSPVSAIPPLQHESHYRRRGEECQAGAPPRAAGLCQASS